MSFYLVINLSKVNLNFSMFITITTVFPRGKVGYIRKRNTYKLKENQEKNTYLLQRKNVLLIRVRIYNVRPKVRGIKIF